MFVDVSSEFSRAKAIIIDQWGAPPWELQVAFNPIQLISNASTTNKPQLLYVVVVLDQLSYFGGPT